MTDAACPVILCRWCGNPITNGRWCPEGAHPDWQHTPTCEVSL